ncbi:MAG: hypothetical protein JXA21_22720 [Anaerolineae bacterium]|nr:hypothetical protein [Anaerolineae bacterium]
MKTSEAFVEQERHLIVEVARRIVSREACEEADILDTIAEEYFDRQAEIYVGHISKGKIFSFGTPEFQAYLTSAILFVVNSIVIPYIKKVLETSVVSAAKESVTELASKINTMLAKPSRSDEQPQSSTRVDLLVPINWPELEHQITVGCQQANFSHKRAQEISQLTVRELSTDQILLGRMVLTVMRIPLIVKSDQE